MVLIRLGISTRCHVTAQNQAFQAQSLPQDAPIGPQKRGQAGPKLLPACELPHQSVVPNLVTSGSTWLSPADLEANVASKLLSSSLQDHSKTSKQTHCKLD